VVTIAATGLCVELGGRQILSGVDLTLAPGRLIGLIGPNGAGKSTLARALLGLVKQSAGQITLDDVDIATLDTRTIARRIAYLPQGQDIHWPLSVERLVALGRLPHLAPFSRLAAADHAAIAEALQETGTAHLANRIATELSGGERARAMLARALATGAPALIADEPLASLDPGHQIDVMCLLAARGRAGGLVIAVLHDLSIAARFCDRLVLLDHGRVRADGDPAAVLTDVNLAQVYGVTAWRGEHLGVPLLVPIAKSDR
jgi:iron complex transport system ATP-binding protein